MSGARHPPSVIGARLVLSAIEASTPGRKPPPFNPPGARRTRQEAADRDVAEVVARIVDLAIVPRETIEERIAEGAVMHIHLIPMEEREPFGCFEVRRGGYEYGIDAMTGKRMEGLCDHGLRINCGAGCNTERVTE